jgi:hypothetical protein
MQNLASSLAASNGHTDPLVIPQGAPFLSEAACSVNIRFRVEGYPDLAQGTGRGANHREAVANLKATMDETRRMLAPTLPDRAIRLAALLACGTQKALARGDAALVERLTKAYILYVRGAIEPADSTAVWAVRSQTSADHYYEVAGNRELGYICSCKDWESHRRAGEQYYTCKHGLVLAFQQKLDEQEIAHEGTYVV